MDNRIFNVNGHGDEFLRDVLDLAFRQHSPRGCCRAWLSHPQKGFILLWSDELDSGLGVINKLPAISAAGVLPLIVSWLTSDEAAKVPCEGWDANADHDGSNSRGWRVYCEDWGRVAGSFGAICAVKPAYLWHGK